MGSLGVIKRYLKYIRSTRLPIANEASTRNYFPRIPTRETLRIDNDKREELMLTEESIMKDYMDIAIFAMISYIYQLGKWK